MLLFAVILLGFICFCGRILVVGLYCGEFVFELLKRFKELVFGHIQLVEHLLEGGIGGLGFVLCLLLRFFGFGQGGFGAFLFCLGVLICLLRCSCGVSCLGEVLLCLFHGGLGVFGCLQVGRAKAGGLGSGCYAAGEGGGGRNERAATERDR